MWAFVIEGWELAGRFDGSLWLGFSKGGPAALSGWLGPGTDDDDGCSWSFYAVPPHYPRSLGPPGTAARSCSHLALDIPWGGCVRHDIEIRHRVKTGRRADDSRHYVCKEQEGKNCCQRKHAIGG